MTMIIRVDNLRGMLSGHISMLSANGVHHSESMYSRKPLNGAVNYLTSNKNSRSTTTEPWRSSWPLLSPIHQSLIVLVVNHIERPSAIDPQSRKLAFINCCFIAHVGRSYSYTPRCEIDKVHSKSVSSGPLVSSPCELQTLFFTF